MSKTYNHMFSIAFTVSGSTKEDGSDVTSKRFMECVLKRIQEVYAEDDWVEACGYPEDTYIEDDPE